MKLWKKVLSKKDNNNDKWKELRDNLMDYMIEELKVSKEQAEEFFRLEYSLKKELGIIGNKDER